MKAYQIKIVLKNSKPPVWRRCLIPAGITFSQLALILDDIVESDQYAGYEYEFYQAGIHVREWFEGEQQMSTGLYDYMCASDTFVDGLADKEEWFTFRPGDGTQYRVEIEKRLPDSIACPLIIKEKVNPQECCWQDMETVNRRLEQRYPIRYGEPDYRMFTELREDVELYNRGLTGASHPVDRTDRNELSGRSLIQATADTLLQYYSNEMKDKLLKESRHPDIRAFLSEESKKTLQEMTEDLHLTRYKSLNKTGLAEMIRNEILKPEVMTARMLLLSDAEIQEFEKAMAKENGFYPDMKEMQNLEKLYDLLYVMLYMDDYAEVPRDVAEVYRMINTPAFQEKRRGTYWLYHCLMMVEQIYASAPVNIVCRMMEKCVDHKVERGELESLWTNIPDKLNPCVLRGDRVIFKEVLQDHLYLRVEETQGNKKYYIPGPDEIIEYTENGYPVSDPYYRRLKTFLIRKMDMNPDEAEEYMPVIWGQVSMGEVLSDIMESFGEDFVFPSEEALKEFVSIMTDINNNTRMLVNLGWTPNEIRKQMPAAPGGKMPTIVPMSSEAARLLGEAADELKGRGFDIDLDHNADEITTMSMPDGISGKTVVGKKKIYPNDPCPCGSGKKYKKCCGRK